MNTKPTHEMLSVRAKTRRLGGGKKSFVRKELKHLSGAARVRDGVKLLVCEREQCWWVFDWLVHNPNKDRKPRIYEF